MSRGLVHVKFDFPVERDGEEIVIEISAEVNPCPRYHGVDCELYKFTYEGKPWEGALTTREEDDAAQWALDAVADSYERYEPQDTNASLGLR